MLLLEIIGKKNTRVSKKKTLFWGLDYPLPSAALKFQQEIAAILSASIAIYQKKDVNVVKKVDIMLKIK